MTPDEYEAHVAALLRAEGWDVTVTPSGRDLGLDVIGVRDGVRLGVQAKMYLHANRPVNAQIIMHTYGAAAYADCDRCMVATDGRVLPDAQRVADKLHVAIRMIAAVPGLGNHVGPSDPCDDDWTFGRIWRDHVMPLTGRTLTRSDGRTNAILKVDEAGLTRRTSRQGAADRHRGLPMDDRPPPAWRYRASRGH